ncbi:MAG TPA: response regulator transcription factor [Ktedonobacterales bacterium]|jgi:DNA-binding NarL/FixJ family response regulator
MRVIRLLIADDHPMFRFGLRALLHTKPGCEVVGEAQTGEEALELAAALEPDLILMDIHLPGINGIQATRRILGQHPHIGILIITMFEDETLFAAMRAGAKGYLLKGAQGEEILRAIHAVANGEAIFSPAVARRLTQLFTTAPSARLGQAFPDLTPREYDILHLMAQGYANQAIADRLIISSKTVRNLISSIFSKLQVADRAQAIVRAREAGLGQDPGR